MKVKNIVLFGSKLGQKKNGVEKTPFYLRNYINNNKKLYEVKCSNDIFYNLENLYKINESINGLKVNIGGDHSMSISTVSDSLNRNKNVKVIWFDAHPDINDHKNSSTKNMHGMPLAYLTKIDNNKKFYYIKNKLNFENLLYIGIRSIDKFEEEIIKKHNIKYINSYNFNNNYDIKKKEISNFIGNEEVHISFDVDCIDPSKMDSTGTKCENGLEIKNLKKIINFLIKEKKIINIDLTELNLSLSNKSKQKESLKTIFYIFNFLFQSR